MPGGVIPDKAVVAVAVKAVFLHQPLRHPVKAVHLVTDAALMAVGPGLIAVEKQPVRLFKGKVEARADMAEHRLPIAVQTEREARVAVFDLPMKAAAAPALRSLAGKAGGFQMNAAEHHAFFPAFSSSILPRIIFSSYRRKRQAPITQVTVAMAATVRYWPASTTASPFTMCLTVTEV